MSPKEVKAIYGDIVEFSGLEDFVNLPVHTYSTGMMQRLRFAIASARERAVLLIDEALTTGDVEFRRRSEQRLAEMRERATTVFLVSHSLDPVTETCDRAIWLERGKLRLDGRPSVRRRRLP